MGWRVTSKKNDGNIEFNFKNGNIDSQQGAPHPPPHGTPFWPRFTVDVAVFEVKFDVTAVDVNIFVVYVPVFDISYFPRFLEGPFHLNFFDFVAKVANLYYKLFCESESACWNLNYKP